jgi:hypothetical protein
MSDKLNNLIQDMYDQDVIEDRREYMPEDLERMYALSVPESQELYNRIQAIFQPKG